MKPIRFSRHASQNLAFRGATEEEVSECIRTADWERSELGRFECRKDFRFDREWDGRQYDTKQVRPIFVDEPVAIVVVTVYVYYF